MSERKIFIHGHNKDDIHCGDPQKMRNYIRTIYSEHKGRYLYKRGCEGNSIVLSVAGKACGHFNVGKRELPREDEMKDFAAQCAYDVHSAVLYATPVPLRDYMDDASTIHVKPKLPTPQFNAIRTAHGVETFYPPFPDDIDPLAVPMIFLRTTWMRFFSGDEQAKSTGGGKWVDEHGYGHEMFNFRPHDGRMYGYVRPVTGGSKKVNFDDGAGIKLERLGGGRKDGMREGVLAVWVAKRPKAAGTYIAGWYRNAIVYRKALPAPAGSDRSFNGKQFGYYVTADVDDARLLDVDQRVFRIPYEAKGRMGQSNVWYADALSNGDFRRDVLRYVETLKPFTSKPKPVPTGTPKQLDTLRRIAIEEAAYRVVTEFYNVELHYAVKPVMRENLGWDLEATNQGQKLLLEVKGLSGSDLCIELTPNEFTQMQAKPLAYRLCVVTEALADPKLSIFSYCPATSDWRDGSNRVLEIEKREGARCSCS